MTPLSCNCLSRPAPSLVILCSEPTRRSPGIVSCSGSHQPVQTLTPPATPHTPPPNYSPPPLCHGQSCWCSPLAVPLADSPHLYSELTLEAPCPHFLLNSHTHCQLHKHIHSLREALNKINLSLAFYYVIACYSFHKYSTCTALCSVQLEMKSSNEKQDVCFCRSEFHFTCQLQN